MLEREALYEALHKEIPILTAQIRKLYAELDQKFHLEGAKVPITFGTDRDCLGSYTQAGQHGSAWKYCCSLVGAAPTPYYKAGEALMNHDYDKVLKPKIHDHTVPMRDHYRREQEYKKTRDSKVQYQVGDSVEHPKFGAGSIEKVEQRAGGVHLHIRFEDGVKKMDQKWVLQTTRYRKAGDR